MEKGTGSLNDSRTLDLVLKAQAGDRNALSQIIALVSPAVHGQAKRIVSSGFDHEDLCQEAMFAVLSAVSSYRADAGASFSTYVNLCIRRKLLKVAEKNNNVITADLPLSDSEAELIADFSAEEKLIQTDSYVQLINSINNLLTEKERSTLELFLSGYTYQEIAAKLSTTPKAVECALARVRRKLGKFKK